MYIDLAKIKNMRDKYVYRLLYVALTRASKDVKILLPNSAKMQDAILNSLDEEFKNLGISL